MTPTCLQEGRSTLHRGFHSLLLPARHLLSFGSQKTSNRRARDELGLILHGSEDPVVPAGISREFAAGRPNVRLQLFPTGHQLTDVLPGLWSETSRFLDLK